MRAEIAEGTWNQFTGQGDLSLDPFFTTGRPEADIHLRPAIDAGGGMGSARVSSFDPRAHASIP